MDKNTIIQLVNEKLAGTDCFLVEVKYGTSRISVSIDKPVGVTIGECTDLSRYLAKELEDKGVLETRELEVGSPGMSEPLRVYQQYLRRIGRELKVTDKKGLEHNGLLKTADAEGFMISTSKIIKEGKKKTEVKEMLSFNYDDIKEAKLIF